MLIDCGRAALQVAWVNRAPYVGRSVLAGVVSSRSSSAEQQGTFDFLDYVSQPSYLWSELLKPDSPIGPCKVKHMTGKQCSRLHSLDIRKRKCNSCSRNDAGGLLTMVIEA
jgi:hypothetical protein